MPEGKLLQSYEDLCEFIGKDPVLLDGYEREHMLPQACMCGVDMEATAALIGLEAESDGILWTISAAKKEDWCCGVRKGEK
ncbi:hypothetical protein D2T29_12545 [Sinirhodobacter populi]|uniref:Uncharacterized protein n=1 Tax=Paenirhodobacter populi TaxID=2306993 RepID=A0A443KD19_9RHOB|nr:hypothetical protein [Sinirhodobacter populi]RWR30493.1 hypothetical protein D2T29_12545 [Sinirhodobacter populi]